MNLTRLLHWIGTSALFSALYILLGSILHYFLTGGLRFFDFGSEMKYGFATWTIALLVQPSLIFANPGWEGAAILLGLGPLIGVIVLFVFSYWVMGKVFKKRTI